jgi:hypothetical protein
MFGKEKGPTRKTHVEHAEEARRHLKMATGNDSFREQSQANVHALFAIYTLLSERLPAAEPPQA